jgi:GTP-binding protein
MQIKKNNFFFIKSCSKKSDFPNDKTKEYTFCGRSNVGKSTLINSLFGDKIARTSKKPGSTKMINLYD